MNVREWALPVYTILIQLAAGTMALLWIVRTFCCVKYRKEDLDGIFTLHLTVIVITILVGIIGSHFHLSKPLLSFYALRNLQTSWLSREALFTILFFGAVMSLWLMHQFNRSDGDRRTFVGWVAVLFGFSSIYCMAKIYQLPTQLLWNGPLTVVSFFITTALLGAMTLSTLMIMDASFSQMANLEMVDLRLQIYRRALVGLNILLAIMTILGVGLNLYQISDLLNTSGSEAISFALISDLYRPLFIMRFASLIIGSVVLLYSIFGILKQNKPLRERMAPVYVASLLLLIGEILGRFLFYATHVRIGV